MYLNAVPLIFGAGSEEVTQKLVESKSWLSGKLAADANATARVETYLGDCHNDPFGMTEDSWRVLLQTAL